MSDAELHQRVALAGRLSVAPMMILLTERKRRITKRLGGVFSVGHTEVIQKGD